MPLVEWKPEFSVGIMRFDDDHRHLITLLNQLHMSLSSRNCNSALSLALRELVWYTQSHFKGEEVHMKRHAYPNLAAHIAEHNRFTEQVVKYVDHFHSGCDAIGVEVSDALQEWLITHILGSDAEYGRFFQTSGDIEIKLPQPASV